MDYINPIPDRFWLKFAILVIIGLVILFAFVLNKSNTPTFALGTGSSGGVYYPAGINICALVNDVSSEAGLCTVSTSAGSVDNIEGLLEGRFSVAIVQSDVQHNAYNGIGRFNDQKPFKDLRALFSLHPEVLTLITRADSGIESIEDILGKRVNGGELGSGVRSTLNAVFEIFNWDDSDFEQITTLPTDVQGEALCDSEIDVAVYVVGHPSTKVEEAIFNCEDSLVFVSVEGDRIQDLIRTYPFYRSAVIPRNFYSLQKSVPAFGVAAVVVTTEELSQRDAYQFTKNVFEGLDIFKKAHPAFSGFEPESISKDAIAIPLHKGAKQYYTEIGL